MDRKGNRATEAMAAMLQQIAGEGLGRVLLLEPGKDYQVGRDPMSHLHIKDETCSRLHARLWVSINGRGEISVSLEDLGSANGTRLGGQDLGPKAPQKWEPGQVAEFGESVRCMLLRLPKGDAEALLFLANHPDKDPATGTLARGSFIEGLQRELDHLVRHPEQDFTVIFLRAQGQLEDGLVKSANRALQFWISVLRGTIRAGTISGRCSDVELAFILRKCDAAGAQAALARYRARIQSAPPQRDFEAPGLVAIHVSGTGRASAQSLLDFQQAEAFKEGFDPAAVRVLEFTAV